jgi:hypothetical protein
MKQVSVKSIENAVHKIDAMDEDALERYSETTVLGQEEFMGYIMSAALEFENEELLNYLMYYYTIFHESFVQEGLTIAKIDETMIETFQEEYFSILDEYQENEDFDVLLAFANQQYLMEFLLMEIQPDEEHPEESLDEDTADHLFLVGTAMISMFSRASN